MVPKDWKYVELGSVIRHKKGYAFNSAAYRDTGTRIIRISDTTRNSIHNENPVYISNELAHELGDYALNSGDILLSTVGSRPHLLDSMVGKAVEVPVSAAGSLLNQNLVKLEPIEQKITANFLFSALKNPEFIDYISTLTRGNANQVSITLNDLFKFKLLLPPLTEQTKIAQIFSAWDKAITATERLLANSQQQKQALMQQLLTGQKRFVGFTDTWSHESFESLVEINYGKSPKDIPKEGDFPVIGTGGLVSNTSIPLYSKPAVVIGRKGTIDKPVLVTTPFWAIDTTFYCYPKPKCDIQWFYYICSNINLKNYNEASGVPSLSRDTLYGITVKAPSLSEQHKIAQVLSTADAEITNLQAQLATLKLEKKALMQQLLTGQRRVKLDADAAA